MKIISFVFVGLAGCLLMSATRAGPVVSYFPKSGLGLFLVEKFDLATIRSSFGPRRAAAQRTFSDFGMKPSSATEDALVFDSPGDWLYELRIVGRGDINGDGIEDLEVCYLERALNGGSYNAAMGLLITKYSTSGYAVALNFSLEDGLCPNYAR